MLRRLSSVCAVAVLLIGCAPTERYYTNKNTAPAQPTAARRDGACGGMATPVSRLQSRSSNQRSVEGFGTFGCVPAPTVPEAPLAR